MVLDAILEYYLNISLNFPYINYLSDPNYNLPPRLPGLHKPGT